MTDSTADGIGDILIEQLGVEIAEIRWITGGDINDAYRAVTSAGTLFVKTRPNAAPSSFAQEAAGLRWLASARGAPPTPAVVLVHDDPPGDGVANPSPPTPRFLALRWIEAGPRTPAGEERFGQQLANLHAADCAAFGWAPPAGGAFSGKAVSNALQIAEVTLPAHPVDDFATFWAEQRVLPLAAQAHNAGTFDAADVALMTRLADRMPELVGPAEPPSRTHGDLWTGNVLADTSGKVHLIDPLAHGSHREVDLAALRVFGGPDQRCFDAYDEAYPLADGHEERVPLMQLSIILLHVVLFGGSYAEQARRIARRYV
ncbi:MAG: fructosamine kinase family protein [Solirubrobacteraceae bacterium]|nr:fructosamine kinase family protein [Solirubrobacteraceae bacterium]